MPSDALESRKSLRPVALQRQTRFLVLAGFGRSERLWELATLEAQKVRFGVVHPSALLSSHSGTSQVFPSKFIVSMWQIVDLPSSSITFTIIVPTVVIAFSWTSICVAS